MTRLFSADKIHRRLVRLLIRFSERFGTTEDDGSVQMGPFTHELLAQYVGTSREIVTHYMNQFRRQGYLRYSRKGIILYRRLLREQMKIVEDGGDPMNTYRDPAKNVSLHVPTEADDPSWRQVGSETAGSVSTGNSGKYSPITQGRARERGYAVPDKVEDLAKEVVSVGYIHPKE